MDTNKLNEMLVDFLEKTLNGVDKATDFLSQEIPEVIWQLLLWHGVKSFLLSCLGLVMIIAFVVVMKKYTGPVGPGKNSLTHDGNKVGPQVMLTGVVSFFYILTSMAFVTNLTWLKIWIAPKVWLLEYARDFL